MPRPPARPVHVLGVDVPARAHKLGGFRAWVSALPESSPRLRATFCSGGVYIDASPQDYDSRFSDGRLAGLKVR